MAQNYYAVLWFKGDELNMVFGLQLSIARVGSAVNFLVMGHLYEYIHQFYKGREALGVTLLSGSYTLKSNEQQIERFWFFECYCRGFLKEWTVFNTQLAQKLSRIGG